MPEVPAMAEPLGADAPIDRGRWGPDDEVGALDHLDATEVLRGARHVRTGEVFTLQVRTGRRACPGDPLRPGREGVERKNVIDASTGDRADTPAFPGWGFVDVAAPLKVVHGTGAPADPVAIR